MNLWCLPALVMCSIISLATGRADDIATVKQRFRASLLPKDPFGVADLARQAERWAASQQPDGSWPDIGYADQERSVWNASEHLERVLQMAKASANRSAPRAQTWRNDALRGISYWESRDPQNPNWWWNEIGVPQLLGECMLLVEGSLTPEQLAGGITILERSKPIPGQGENTVWKAGNTVVRGCLENDPAVVADAFLAIYGELRIVGPTEDGIQADYSFHQHGPQFYSGGYGYAFGDDTARFTAFAWGTAFQIPPKPMDVLSHFLLDGQQWMVRTPIFDYSALGREITRKGKVAVPKSWSRGPIAPVGAAYAMLNTIRGLAKLPVPRRREFADFAARLQTRNPALSGHRHFWKSDYTVHQRPGYFTSVRMFSNRLLNTEMVNGEGKRSHHLADGATFIYRTGAEYSDIFPVWDWERVPGTTIERVTPPFDSTQIQQKGKTSFVGGVSDGTYGLAAMDLDRDHLTARKAWVYFDDEFVCLGAGITCTAPDDVTTSLNQCLLTGPVTISDGSSIANGERDLHGDRWVLHDRIGYVFPADTTVHLKAGPQSGRWSDIGTGSDALVTDNVFSLWLDHGAQPADASYEYTVVPGATGSSLNARLRNNPIVILANNRRVQAVLHRKLKIILAAFWNAGSVVGEGWKVSVDHRCLILFHEVGHTVEAAVSNPANASLVVHVTVNRPLNGAHAEPRPGGTRLTFRLPGGDAAGSSVVQRFRLSKERAH